MFRLLFLLFSSASLLSAAEASAPQGMQTSGRRMHNEGILRAGKLVGIVMDEKDRRIPKARVQVESVNSEKILQDLRADRQGRFRLARLKPGAYWLGVSGPGFPLHYWRLIVVHFGRSHTLRAHLSADR